jgi:hypothetical protein
MSLTPVDIAADVVAGVLALSKLFTTAQPLWAKLPRWLAVALPVIVVDSPQVAAAFGVVSTGTDLATALLTSVALLLPGVAEAETSPAVTAAVAAVRTSPVAASTAVAVAPTK